MSKRTPLGQKFSGIDMFGSPIKFTYQKTYLFTTKFGAAGTVIMYIILFSYAIEGLIRVLTNEVNTVSSQMIKLDMENNPGFSPGNATYLT